MRNSSYTLLVALFVTTCVLPAQEARTAQDVNLRAAPTLHSKVIRVLEAGESVSRLGRRAHYDSVRTTRGDEGWVYERYLTSAVSSKAMITPDIFSPTSKKPLFEPSCAHPHFPEPAPIQSLDIEFQCGLEGSDAGATDNAGKAEAQQNRIKNNFCATGSPSPISIQEMSALHKKAAKDGVTFGLHKVPLDRSPLRASGEGTVRELTGYVLIARQEGGESVNCGANVPNQDGEHDIHISIAQHPNLDECTGIVAEMIPHHRPSSWTQKNVLKVANAGVPVRVIGQLFFDASHVPCAGGKGVGHNPKRSSLWEIHPIYQFDVCDAQCSTNPKWISLSAWVGKH